MNEKQQQSTRFRLEPSTPLHLELSLPSTSLIMVENPQEETRWYWKYFLGNEHQNYAGIDSATKTPFFMSILVEEMKGERMCRAILWTPQGQRRLLVPITGFPKILTAKSVLQQFADMSDYNRSLKEIISTELQRELVVLEDQEGGINCKFGVIYALKTQSSDIQMFSNEHGDDNFERFIKLLGQRIELQNWGSYRGGLDTSSNSTGRESVYTVFEGHEIMFHVSTLLPYSRNNRQQIERKRHVGNDIVNIVFETGGNPEYAHFSPTMIQSQFTHVFAVVTYDKLKECYRLWIYTEETVPVYGPTLPCPNVFYDAQKFREFLLTKCIVINAEKAAFQAKVFVEKRRNTIDAMIKDMYMEHMKKMNKLGIGKITDNVIRRILKSGKKDKTKELTGFCKFGELVKLEKLLSGDISHTFKSVGICPKQPWEPEIISEDSVAWSVLDSDSWSSKSVLLASDDSGVILINEGQSIPAIEANICAQQLAVEEHFGLIIIRIDTGKESSLVAMPLTELRVAVQTGQIVHRESCLKYRILLTKGCHLFKTIDTNDVLLDVIACVGKNLILLRWNIKSLKRFQYVKKPCDLVKHKRTLPLADEATTVSVLQQKNAKCTLKVVVLGRASLVIADFETGLTECIQWNVPKNLISTMHAFFDGYTNKILLCHKNVTMAIDTLSNGACSVKETYWSCPLKTFICRLPYILGFGDELIEIRLAINGNLLCSMYMPHVKVLSTKDDIIFATDNYPCSSESPKSRKINALAHEFPKIRSHLNKLSNSDDINHERIRRWNIYRISGIHRQQEDHNCNQSSYHDYMPQLLTPRYMHRLQGKITAAADDSASDNAEIIVTRYKERSAPNSPYPSTDSFRPSFFSNRLPL